MEESSKPHCAIRGGRQSIDLAIKVALDKYLDHLPLARQEYILHRHRLEVTTQALWDQVDAIARRLAPTDAIIRGQ
ncbi:transposase [Sorangium sp. So ce590]|uniref:IS66 family transposase n=1 Tax=Sorangium sp. So ce590 TaxID=3133317 RepID=UPI003F62929B